MQKYMSSLRVLDATKAFYLSTMWSIYGLRVRTESSGIYAMIGERNIALPYQEYFTIPWEKIDNTICFNQALGSKIIHFLDIKVSESNDETWAKFVNWVSPYLDNEARITMNLLGLEPKLVALTKSIYDDANIHETLDEIDRTLNKVKEGMVEGDSNYEALDNYKQRLEQLRYDACIEVLRRDINDEKLVSRAIAEVYNTALQRFRR